MVYNHADPNASNATLFGPAARLASARAENSSMCHMAGFGGGEGIGLSATTLHPG
jgi:hypothetical protein